MIQPRKNMLQLTKEEFARRSIDIWTTEREDLPNWAEIRHLYMGKRTMLAMENGATTLLIEDLHFEIVD